MEMRLLGLPGLACRSVNSDSYLPSVITAVVFLTFLEGVNCSIVLDFNRSFTFALAFLITLTFVDESILVEAAWFINPWATPAALPIRVFTYKASLNLEMAMRGVIWCSGARSFALLASFHLFLEAFGVTIIGA